MKFKLGQTVMTRGIANLMEQDPELIKWINNCLFRHQNGDWGDLCEEDKNANELAFLENDRILSTYVINYKFEELKIYIITEYDRSATTILLSKEY